MFRTHFPPFKFPAGTIPNGIPMAPWEWLDEGRGAGRAAVENE